MATCTYDLPGAEHPALDWTLNKAQSDYFLIESKKYPGNALDQGFARS
ncbi:hypothetical protein [Streptomyces sp. NPDC058653]